MTIKTDIDMTTLRHSLQAAYLDYCNDFIGVDVFANYYGIGLTEAHHMIAAGRLAHEAIVDELRVTMELAQLVKEIS